MGYNNPSYAELENYSLRSRLREFKLAARMLIDELKEKGYDETEAVMRLKRVMK